MPDIPTWDSIRLAALRCPYLYAAVHMSESGQCSRESALTWAALRLSEANRRLVDLGVEQVKWSPTYFRPRRIDK